MRAFASRLVLALGLIAPLLLARVASAQEQPAAEALPPPPPAQPVTPQAAAQGQWVDTDAYGWVWVPTDTTAYDVGSQPYVYVYTPAYGWTWYVSPWGRGRFMLGPWVHTRWGAPHVWMHGGWVAPRGRVAPVHVRVAPVRVAPHVHVAPSHGRHR